MMVFSSATFLFIFLPMVWIIYTAVPQKYIRAKNIILTAAGLIFHAFGEPVGMLLLLSSSVINWALAKTISHAIVGHNEKKRKTVTAVLIVFNIGVLFVFKYAEWFISLIADTLSLKLPAFASGFTFTLSIGISFYTLQMLSYVIDVSRGKIEAEEDVGNVILYASFFPKLTAGPIVPYSSVKSAVDSRIITPDAVSEGIRRFIFGLSKKLLIADTVAVISDAAFAAASPSSALAWTGALCFCLQFYFDFSGYSDMAVGLAEMFGFRLDENFRYPFCACTVRDFFGRWHITLTDWFREYVYVPLGENSISAMRTVINCFIVFLLAGMWHGAGLTFILCGLFNAALVSAENLSGMKKASDNVFLRPMLRIYTLLCVILTFVMFRSVSVPAAFEYFGCMFSFSGNAGDILALLSGYRLFIAAVGIVLCFPVFPAIRGRLGERAAVIFDTAGYVFSAVLFLMCIMNIASNEFRPFIFYRF